MSNGADSDTDKNKDLIRHWIAFANAGFAGSLDQFTAADYVGHSGATAMDRSELERLGANVGYVVNGEYRWWDEGAPVQEILRDIAVAFGKFGPYMTLTTLPDAFTFRGAAELPGRPYSLVVIALLNRDMGLVLRQLADAEAILCRQADGVCDQFRDFETRVRVRLSADPDMNT